MGNSSHYYMTPAYSESISTFVICGCWCSLLVCNVDEETRVKALLKAAKTRVERDLSPLARIAKGGAPGSGPPETRPPRSAVPQNTAPAPCTSPN